MADRTLGAWASAPRVLRGAAAVAVVAATVAVELAFFGDRLGHDVRLILDRPRGGEVAARSSSPPAPLPVLGPPAAGSVAGVDVRPLDGCRPGRDCTVVVQVRLQPAAEPRPVDWRVVVVDRCRHERTTAPGDEVVAPPGADRVARLTTLRLPPGRSLAVTAVTGSPATVAARPLPLSGGDRSC